MNRSTLLPVRPRAVDARAAGAAHPGGGWPSAIWIAAACVAGLAWRHAPAAEAPFVIQPVNVDPQAPALIKSVGDAVELLSRRDAASRAVPWSQRRGEVEAATLRMLGLAPLPARTPLRPRVVAQHEFAGYAVENLSFESRPGFVVTANLYRPLEPATSPRPAVACPVGHYLSAGKTATEVQTYCIQLARLGFVALTYDAIGQGERLAPENIHHEAGYALLPLGETIAGWMAWDTMRAIDLLAAREDVDPQRIGVTGNSGGGLNSWLVAALDPRVRTGVVVGFTFDFANWARYGGAHCTCTHFPGAFADVGWHEIAGLTAPRPLLMIQGSRDLIFPVGGARRAAAGVSEIYRQVAPRDAAPDQRVRLVVLADQPHAYSRPFREAMYGWMRRWLSDQGDGTPLAEEPLDTLPENDPRLLCYGGPPAPGKTVVALARSAGLARLNAMPAANDADQAAARRRWIEKLVAPPVTAPHDFAPQTLTADAADGPARVESFAFNSEEGVRLEATLWRPADPPTPGRAVVIVDQRGRRSDRCARLARELAANQVTAITVDLRGRGASLSRYGKHHDIGFRLAANQVLMGEPLAGRRAYDLRRTVDFFAGRKELANVEWAAAGFGADALPVLLAAAVDTRLRSTALVNFQHSFLAGMRARTARPGVQLSQTWNDPQLRGIVDCGDQTIDFGSVIPGVLTYGDVPDLAGLAAPRQLYFCDAADRADPAADALAKRFQSVLRLSDNQAVAYAPQEEFSLTRWLDMMRRASP